jgi:glycosyltransferase involved in cell wall biosynthesis
MNLMKKKLLIFHPFLATYRLDLYNFLSNHFDLMVYLWYDRVKQSNLAFNLSEVNNMAQFKFKYVENGWMLGTRSIDLSFLKIILDFKPDIILSHEFGLNTILSIFLKKLLGYNLFVTSDDSPIMALSCTGIREILRRFCLRNIDGLIVINPEVINILNNKYSKIKCNYLYLPIIQDDSIFKAKLLDSIQLSNKLLDKMKLKEQKVILYVGRLEKVKSVDVLIRTFYEIDKINQNVKLVIVGDGSQATILINLVNELHLNNKVLFCGKLSGNELYAWYNIAHIFVLPSQFEPFGAVINEALMAGCYTIVSDKVGAKCLINQSNGAIFQSDNTNELSSLLIEKLSNMFTLKTIVSKENLMTVNSDIYFNNLITFITL